MSKERKQEKKRRNSRPKLRYILSFLAFMFCFLFTLKIHDIKAASYAKVINVKLKDGQDATTEIQKALDEAAKAGVTAIIQPGGSIRDQEVIDAANEYGMAMVFTGCRVFRHG